MDTSQDSPARGRSIEVWDFPLRLFHWLLVVAIALAFLSSEEESPLAAWHVPVGWSIAVLLAFRLTWGFVGGEHARFAQFVKPSALAAHIKGLLHGRPEATLGHNALGALSVLLLLGLIAATVWTGAVGVDEEVHELIAYTLLGLVALHIGAVVMMSFLTRENLVRAMITGRKRRDRHPTADDARPPSPLALILATLAAAATVIGVLAYDPHSFQPQTREAGEHSPDVDSVKAPDAEADR
ncbi:cytochrome b/b6 domain-containing protein [Sphingomonas sp. LB-2]|uniref:cytochrome b/b6 domain-containing protein n=1 Tax=Sphingomonas caeni TaxID=2984949 RepID=UPI00222EF2E8|nr:cytochrome b/b6 domain-containing protein [Sphingomonas caeni]MCW3849535.1 cytochrome b/b6 domain-containing protein [Sphingomonas caeni]